MARITRDSSVLNQIGSPSINSNTFLNRPAFGQVGRLFVDTTNNLLQRDTGTSWVTIGAAASLPNLEQVTTIGNSSTKGIFLGIIGSLTTGLQFEVSGYSRFSQTVVSAANLGSNVNQYFELQTNGTTIATGSPSPSYSQLTIRNNAAQTIGGAGNVAIGAGLFENVITDTGTGSYPLTITQTVGISALSPIISYSRYTGTFGSAISHYAGLVINGIQATAGSALGITNNYQLLINSSQQFTGSTTVTNRWGIYQNGVNDTNYFAGKLFINETTTNFNQFYCNGPGAFNNSLIITSFDDNLLPIVGGLKMYTNQGSSTSFIQSGKRAVAGWGLNIGGYPIIFTNSNVNNEVARFNIQDNFLIGTTTNTGRKLVVNGNLELLITPDSGTHTPSIYHIPIWISGVQYFIQLLNPSA